MFNAENVRPKEVLDRAMKLYLLFKVEMRSVAEGQVANLTI